MNAILDEARRRGITRLCHLTPSANLAHILAAGELRPVADLRQGGDAYRPVDRERRDGAPGHLFLSVEYPNVWYHGRASARDANFTGWVVLTFGAELLARPGTRFSPYNSARDGSAGALEGPAGFGALFAPAVTGNATRVRRPGHPDWWPTDDQAEIQISGAIPLSAVREVLFPSEQQAALDHFALARQFGMGHLLPPLSVAPEVFDAPTLSGAVRAGSRVGETRFVPAAEGAAPAGGATP
ncbi:DUF4433 domain-containing protein [Streptomyces sp. NBC_01795]|uniref:DarT ssDNA thymidine ADP-ribosyltransferase family protein n=1 Tax=unclassified Streptomyces TaxID=2593676 RepID=UPI002DDAEFC7|nr:MULTISPECIES: DarT ssDNA thymidine ADP-ribosyltransferase family protein [unclassified Streptomyces]WSA95204.1 DUF4433 domain-containing protein [Streptomyces sp. NBC_01795]WSB79622.1 DUF4433 domain-containing protein [Streptomyces sp. NBC_01775]WSS12175.1 DUF4433 domain-containing protein [Streptomyces sp. NBC_01186]